MRTIVLAGILIAGLGAVGCAGRDGDAGHWGAWRGAHWTGHGHGPCASPRRDAWMDRMLARAERRLDLTTEQMPSWERLAGEVRQVVDATCAAATGGGEPRDAAAAFARLERVASTGAAGIERVRPAFDDFYAGLDAEQRRTLDRLLTGRHWG